LIDKIGLKHTKQSYYTICLAQKDIVSSTDDPWENRKPDTGYILLIGFYIVNMPLKFNSARFDVKFENINF
jgi:hypothetical protein